MQTTTLSIVFSLKTHERENQIPHCSIFFAKLRFFQVANFTAITRKLKKTYELDRSFYWFSMGTPSAVRPSAETGEPCLEHEPPPCPRRNVNCHAIVKDRNAFWMSNMLHAGETIPFLSYLALYRLPGLIPQPLLFVLPQIGAMKINHVIGRTTVSRHGRWRAIDGIYPFDDLQGHGSLRKRRTRHTGICFRGT